MAPYTLRMIPILLAFIFGIVMIVPQFGQGEAATSALAAYERLMPGNPIPEAIDCEGVSGFYDSTEVQCRMEVGAYCQQGYMAGREGVIVHTTFFGCQFPVAYLLAHYGRYDQVRRYRRVLVLRWPGVYAHVRRQGWLNAMEPVSIVTWWTPPEPIE